MSDDQPCIGHLRIIQWHIINKLNSYCFHSYDLSSSLGVHQEILKPILRRMRIDGLIKYHRGGFDEDGNVSGAGHYVTALGKLWHKDYKP